MTKTALEVPENMQIRRAGWALASRGCVWKWPGSDGEGGSTRGVGGRLWHFKAVRLVYEGEREVKFSPHRLLE